MGEEDDPSSNYFRIHHVVVFLLSTAKIVRLTPPWIRHHFTPQPWICDSCRSHNTYQFGCGYYVNTGWSWNRKWRMVGGEMRLRLNRGSLVTGHGRWCRRQNYNGQPREWGSFIIRHPSSRVRLQFARRSIRQPESVCVFELKVSLHNPIVATNELIKITISWLISCKKLSSKGSQSRSFWIILMTCITGSGYENTRLADQRKVQVRTSYQKGDGVDNGVSSVCQGNF